MVVAAVEVDGSRLVLNVVFMGVGRRVGFVGTNVAVFDEDVAMLLIASGL